jgi:hypothetical protein
MTHGNDDVVNGIAFVNVSLLNAISPNKDLTVSRSSSSLASASIKLMLGLPTKSATRKLQGFL